MLHLQYTFRTYTPCRKLGEWDDEDGFGPAITEEDKIQAANKNSRVVVLKHMFTTEELEEDASLLLDLKEDVREECSTLGEVTNVVLYDVSATFRSTCMSSCSAFRTERTGGYHDSQVQRPSERAGMRTSKLCA